MNETQLTILGFRLWNFAFGVGVWPHEGNPHSVVMDIRKPLKWRRWLLGFYHTHPNILNYPSNTDIHTFFTWGNALGKPIYCLIDGIDAERMNESTAISNYLFITFPMSYMEDQFIYYGHAYKIGRFFFWKGL